MQKHMLVKIEVVILTRRVLDYFLRGKFRHVLVGDVFLMKGRDFS